MTFQTDSKACGALGGSVRFMKLTNINGKWVAAGNDPFPPEPDRARTELATQDRKISPHPKVDRISQGKFYVSDLVIQPSVEHTSHTFSAECEYCHQTIAIHLFAPTNPAKYVKDEACRIAIIEHLRTEHSKPKNKQL
jgi:hypothetical protein